MTYALLQDDHIADLRAWKFQEIYFLENALLRSKLFMHVHLQNWREGSEQETYALLREEVAPQLAQEPRGTAVGDRFTNLRAHRVVLVVLIEELLGDRHLRIRRRTPTQFGAPKLSKEKHAHSDK